MREQSFYDCHTNHLYQLKHRKVEFFHKFHRVFILVHDNASIYFYFPLGTVIMGNPCIFIFLLLV